MANFNTGTIDYDNLVLSSLTPIVETRILATGESVKRGQVLKLDTGKMVAFDEYDSAADANAIAAEDAEAVGGDSFVSCYVFGAFNAGVVEDASALTLDLATIEALRARGVYAVRTVAVV